LEKTMEENKQKLDEQKQVNQEEYVSTALEQMDSI